MDSIGFLTKQSTIHNIAPVKKYIPKSKLENNLFVGVCQCCFVIVRSNLGKHCVDLE